MPLAFRGIDVEAITNAVLSEVPEQDTLLQLFDALNTTVGAIANWFQVITTLAPVIEQFWTDVPDPIRLIGSIATKVTEIEQGVQGGTVLMKVQEIQDKIQTAQDRLVVLLMDAKNRSDVSEPLFFADVQDAAYTLGTDDAYWVRSYVDDFVFTDYWFAGNTSPPVINLFGTNFVYDPQLALPAFVTAITIFTAVVTIFHPDPNDPADVRRYFTDLATMLDSRYQQATAGLMTVPLPSSEMLSTMRAGVELYSFENYFNWFNFDLRWRAGYWPGEVGAVDIYSVFSKVAGFPGYVSAVWQGDQSAWGLSVTSAANPGNIIDMYQSLEDLLPWAPDRVYRWFRIRMRIGNLARLKALYIVKGYQSVWSQIQKLRRLSAGEPGTAAFDFPATPPPEATDRNAHWCLSELDPLISADDSENLFGNPFLYEKFFASILGGDPPPPISVEDIISRLQAVIDISTDSLLNLNGPSAPVPTPPRPLSLRATLAAAAV